MGVVEEAGMGVVDICGENDIDDVDMDVLDILDILEKFCNCDGDFQAPNGLSVVGSSPPGSDGNSGFATNFNALGFATNSDSLDRWTDSQKSTFSSVSG
jgi:hypothetical protein